MEKEFAVGQDYEEVMSSYKDAADKALGSPNGRVHVGDTILRAEHVVSVAFGIDCDDD